MPRRARHRARIGAGQRIDRQEHGRRARAVFHAGQHSDVALLDSFYATFEERLGYPCDYRPQGYLFCATTNSQMSYLRTNYAQQVKMGLKNVRLMTGDEIRGTFPQLRADDIVGGSFCSSDGFVDPYSAMTGFMTWAANHGATLWKNTDVTGFKRDASGIAAVETTRGSVATRKVVNCAGAWAAGVAKLAGVDLPVEPLRRMLVPSEPFDEFPHTAPMIVDMSNGFHFRPEVAAFSWPGTIPKKRRGSKRISTRLSSRRS